MAEVAPPPKRGTFYFRVVTLLDAEQSIRIAWQTCLALAILQAVIMVFLIPLRKANPASLLDPTLLLVFGWLIKHRCSRTAAVGLAIYLTFVTTLTVLNHAGVKIEGTFGGKNVVLPLCQYRGDSDPLGV